MVNGYPHKPRRIALVFLALSGMCQACSTPHSGFRFTGDGTEAVFQNWRKQASPQTREAIDALNTDDKVLIHIIRGKIEGEVSRGTSAQLAADPISKRACLMHPAPNGIKPHADWDIIWDEELQKRMEKKLKLQSPIEALLQHEILGHVIPAINDPLKARKRTNENEDYAIQRENEYRQHVGLPLVPWTFSSARRGD
jgi:hypothetical protein